MWLAVEYLTLRAKVLGLIARLNSRFAAKGKAAIPERNRAMETLSLHTLLIV